MANGQHGGYRKPSRPAPVSGPGSMSKRTDGGPIDGQPVQDVGGFEYGGRKEFRDIQSSAPMSSTNSAPRPVKFTPLASPTERPNEPVTAGAALGPGPGQNLSTSPSRVAQLFQRIAAAATDDETGKMEYIANLLMSRGL